MGTKLAQRVIDAGALASLYLPCLDFRIPFSAVTIRQYRKSHMIDSVFKITWGHMSSPPNLPWFIPLMTNSREREKLPTQQGGEREKKIPFRFFPICAAAAAAAAEAEKETFSSTLLPEQSHPKSH